MSLDPVTRPSRERSALVSADLASTEEALAQAVADLEAVFAHRVGSVITPELALERARQGVAVLCLRFHMVLR